MRFISIRTKILAALLLLTTGVLVVFLLTARSLFEKDKTAYLYDANQRSAQDRALFVNEQIHQWLLATGALGLYVDIGRQSLGEAGEILLSRSKDVEGLVVTEMRPEGLSIAFAKSRAAAFDPAAPREDLSRTLRTGERLPALKFDPARREVYLHQTLPSVDGRLFYLSFSLRTSKLAPLFGGMSETRHLLLDRQLSPVMGMEAGLSDLWREILAKAKLAGLSDVSQLIDTGQGPFLVSFSRLADFDFFVVSVTPESAISRVLRDLTVRSFYVFALIFFAVLGISVLFAKGITSNLEQLAEAVRKISRGDFNLDLRIRSRDETAKLAEGFRSMSTEIERLLAETAEKSRMQNELRTARAVQATLFPETRATEDGFTIAGGYRSASECGGDWWYHRRRGDYLYVVIADATGHGAPAALITSAARAAFGLATADSGPLIGADELARQFNRAVFETSKGGIQMTALILRINVRTGDAEVVNCSHELPILLDPSGTVTYPELPVVPRLGESLQFRPFVERLRIEPGWTMVLLTDGVADVASPEGKSFGERRLRKLLKESRGEAGRMLDDVESALEKFRAGADLKDDVTLVVIARSGLGETPAHP